MDLRFVSFAMMGMLVVAPRLAAQDDPCTHRAVPIGLIGADSKSLAELTPGDFRASIKKKPIRITSITPNQSPVRAVIVLDASGSMTRTEKNWKAYIDVAEGVLGRLPSASPVGLIVFSDKVETTGQLTVQRSLIFEKFEQLRSRRQIAATAIYEALNAAAMLFPSPSPGDVIYAISDGQDTASRIGPEAAKDALLSRGIRLYTFSVGTIEHPIRKLVQETGGYSVVVTEGHAPELSSAASGATKTSKDWQSLLQQFRLLYEFAVLQIELPEALHQPTVWDLKIDRPEMSKLPLVFPHELPACTVPQSEEHKGG